MLDSKKTKIIATIGPVSDSKEKIKELINAGVNIFRFNMKHATIEWHDERIKRVNAVAKKLDLPIGVLVDLQGPEIRINTRGAQEIIAKKGKEIYFSDSFKKEEVLVVIPNKIVFAALEVGDFFSIDDGSLEFTVTKKKGTNEIAAQAMEDGIIKNRKGINIPGKNINLPSLIADDLKKLDMVAKNGVNFIAHSFSRTKKDLQVLRREMDKRKIKAKIVAKIENRQALDNIDEIIDTADAIMIARGDLGIEIPIEELTFRQKRIIIKCRKAKKPVITATQMLQSMVKNQRPTRAEATDVANAVFDGTDAVMLSEETSAGKYPVEAVQVMAKILKYNEHCHGSSKTAETPDDLKQLIMNAAVSIINDRKKADIEVVVIFTESGYTARVLSSFHPRVPIIAVTDTDFSAYSLVLSYGVRAVHMKDKIDTNQSSRSIIEYLKKKKLIKIGQMVLFIHGEYRNSPGPISSISLVKIR